jgi:hypothetical protein
VRISTELQPGAFPLRVKSIVKQPGVTPRQLRLSVRPTKEFAGVAAAAMLAGISGVTHHFACNIALRECNIAALFTAYFDHDIDIYPIAMRSTMNSTRMFALVAAVLITAFLFHVVA